MRALRQADCRKRSMRTRCPGGERRSGGSASRWWSGRARSLGSGRCVPFSLFLFFFGWLAVVSKEREAHVFFLAGACAVALAGRVFFADLNAGHAHVLPRVPARIFLLWVRRSGKRVRAPFSVSLSRIGWVSNIFCRLGFAMRSLLACIYRRF